MEIANLSLDHFRNYQALSLDFSPGVNVLYGLNGQGKTNLLEAIYLCTAARSHRTARDSDLIHHDSDEYGVKLSFKADEHARYQESLEIIYKKGRSGVQAKRSERIIKHDGIVLPKVGDLMGHFHAVMFAPEDLSLIKDGPGARRRFLDILISQLKPLYFQSLQRLQTLLAQRNSLLKQAFSSYNKGNYVDQIKIWNIHLAQVSAEIIHERYLYCKRISNIANEFHTHISQDKEHLSIKYRTRSELTPSLSINEIASQLNELLDESIDEDIRRGYTTIGPHRDDLIFKCNDNDIRLFGSQGQQRTAVLALKLSELRIIQEDTNENPVLLLDDVMSELDRYRRQALVEAITDCQIFITCTEPEHILHDWGLLESLQISLYHVSQGEVSLESASGGVV